MKKRLIPLTVVLCALWLTAPAHGHRQQPTGRRLHRFALPDRDRVLDFELPESEISRAAWEKRYNHEATRTDTKL